ncbi:CC-NBS-LRR class disease resistance protein, putative [Theobroma cacao]|uniref:CC-NBS-LRR class disease resistance protein, putative n=1 Tax=Theobroma cacao TaxID=3641 RepID=A0A061F8A3_THECC|nr:CC-NBS-LRR class disease resistance protein, putative [Theobroma cacao]
MAWSAVSSAVIRIGELLTQEATSLWGVEERVDRLQRELRWMQSFLADADARQGESERVRLWVAEIRDLAYDAEDIIETFALKIGSKRKGGFSNVVKRSACILKEGRVLHKTRSKIEKIISSISELTRQLQTYGIKESRNGEESSSSCERRELRRSYPHIIEDNIVGMDDEIQKLVSVLVDEESHSRVVSICGMGGLGKTTLAKKIYHHRKIRGHFSHWLGKRRDEELAEKLFNFLKDKNCLVVLDDIWSVDAWDSLKAALPTKETNSKILLTSRNKEVALHADTRSYLHELQCLNDEDSWELFQSISFPERTTPDYKVDSRRVELGKGMVKHCAGLPLAIIVLGGILTTKNSFDEWQMVSENVKSYLKRSKGQGTEHVLALSYDDLPPYLRPCFLYLSHFPEDYEIPVETLIQLWVAEGLVSSKEDEGNRGEFMEDVAVRYLIELVERCMIHVGERDATLKIKTCRMHDLMRDFCLSKAKQENFVYVIDHSNSYKSTKNFPPSITARRIAAHECTLVQCIKSAHLRSIFFFASPFHPDLVKEAFLNPKMLKYNEEYDGEFCNPLIWVLVVFLLCKVHGSWTCMFNHFKLLRVLYIEGQDILGGCKFPSAMGDLIHLRFLSLRELGFIWPKFPSSLGNLSCLQTLDLRVEERPSSIHVPNVIWKLEQLRHLYLPKECNRKTKLKLHTLAKLQTLVNFNTQNCFVGDLSNMLNLRKLEIFGPFNIEDFKEDLDKKLPIIQSKRIRSLFIHSRGEGIDPLHVAFLLSSCSTICELVLSEEIGMLPEHHHFSSNIAYIHLCGCHLAEDPMPTLEKLPNLRILILDSQAFSGKKMVCSAECFPKLDSLSLHELENLEEWKVDEGAMPALCHLDIVNCRKLKMLPAGLRFITTLQQLKIDRMPKAFKDKLVEGGEDFYKVQHVPSIIFLKLYEDDDI